MESTSRYQNTKEELEKGKQTQIQNFAQRKTKI